MLLLSRGSVSTSSA